MKLKLNAPKKALNKAFLKQRPLRSEIDLFKKELSALINGIDHKESEEHHKNNVSDFLKKAIYKEQYTINTKDKKDLVIHNGNTVKTPVAVIIEAKKPDNKAEWLSADKPNAKALQELVLYYMSERIEEKNNNIQYLIATNINEWFIIEAKQFEHLFYENKAFVKEYTDWRDGKKVTKETSLFYNEIAKPRIDAIEDEIPCAHFKLENYKKQLLNDDKVDDKALIELYKILSPQHLLKVPFANDSNELDERFYKELLHIIGLEEAKEGGKNIIRRKKENRDNGALIELAIQKLKTENNKNLNEEEIFNVALELCITWINRILFLKLLEGQLLSYHKGDKSYQFLHQEMIVDFDELYELFHEVLAVKVTEREDSIKNKYAKVPYLNSSLFEISDLESNTLRINALSDTKKLKFPSYTILKEQKAKSEDCPTLSYFFQFLNAYDFSGEGTEGIQEDNKTLINASVLGKVFEKINGYKDGSIYTPAFITMYMCREAIRRAVIQKFNEVKQWNVKDFTELENKIEDKKEANQIINDLKICDPAVGSGHFLVSALNEILLIKHDLKILLDKDGKRLRDYHLEIQNDELIVTDDEGNIIFYNPKNKESQRVQETLFIEKQTIIENCLFGVDINPNSVKICRLRLWIELLKNAYYKNQPNQAVAELETLPNIDINIKCGNSLLSRFGIDADLSNVLKSIKYDIKAYRGFVNDYKNCKDREAKRGLQHIIDNIKGDFKTEILKNDPKQLRLNRLNGELFNLTQQTSLFEEDEKAKKLKAEKIKTIESEILKLNVFLEEIKNNAIYKDAFEWRFEFPEVLDNDGNFVGFDVVIGNPPYFSLSKIKELAHIYSNYVTFSKGTDIYCLFYERGFQILKSKGFLNYITSNSWLKVQYGESLRKFFIENTNPKLLINIESSQVFQEATVETNIILSEKFDWQKDFWACSIKPDFLNNNDYNIFEYFENNKIFFNNPLIEGWILGSDVEQTIKLKIENGSKLIKNLPILINYGIKTGLNEAFIIDENTKNELISLDAKNAEIIKPILRGRDLKKYKFEFENIWIIFTRRGFDIKEYKYIEQYLQKYYEELKPRNNRETKGRKAGRYKWFELQDDIAYFEEFDKDKIIWGELSDKAKFVLDTNGYYINNTIFFLTGNNLKYLLAILNSKLSEWYFNQISTTSGMGTNRWLKYKIEQLPIKDISESEQTPFITLVDEILSLKAQSEDSSTKEKDLDELIYDLYELSPDEKNIIRNA